jgi:hypothetical protein
MNPDVVLLYRNLRTIFGPKRQEVKDGGKTLKNDKHRIMLPNYIYWDFFFQA